MRLPKDRCDRVMLGTGIALVGLGIVVGASLFPPATASDKFVAPARTEVFRAQPVRGVVPHAHTVSKIVKTDGLASIVRDPKDLPPPIGKRGPQRVKVDLETVEVTGKLA